MREFYVAISSFPSIEYISIVSMTESQLQTRSSTPEAAALATPETEDDRRNPVSTALDFTEYGHLGGEAAIEGDTAGSTIGKLAGSMGHEAVEAFAGEATTAQTSLYAANGIFGPLAIAGGMMEMIEGRGEIHRGDTAGGILSMAGGGASMISGASAFTALAGLGSAAVVAPLAGAAGVGLKGGHYGDQEVEKLGWLHGDDGKAESASSWVADNASAANDMVAEGTGSKWMGRLAGADEFVASLVPAALTSVGAAADGGVRGLMGLGGAIGSRVANGDRANTYASSAAMSGVDGLGIRDPKTGQVQIAQKGTAGARQAAQSIADYDDGAEAAIERSKKAHPERWGGAPANAPTVQDWISQMSRTVAQTTHKARPA